MGRFEITVFTAVFRSVEAGSFLPSTVLRNAKTVRSCLYLAAPASIYAIYNNLTNENLTNFDPGSYQVLMQTRVLFTTLLSVWILGNEMPGR